MGFLETRQEILDIIYTCKGMSSFPRHDIPYDDLAVHYSKMEGWNFENVQKTRKLYEGFTDNSLEKLDGKRNVLLERISSLGVEIPELIPFPTGNEKEYEKAFDKGESKELDNVFINLYKQYRKDVGDIITVKSLEEDVPELWELLEKLAKSVISLRIIREVEGEILDEGKYEYRIEFSSAAAACNYYRDKVVDDFNAFSDADVEKLKIWFEKGVKIKRKNEKSSINKLLSTWIGDERKRQNLTRGRADE